ncbi:uncharacterized protein LOC110247467 [Exaiptasia diaphana]|uniref:Uncharacterized protein n=1 Tax=Exaiptasia diaphana TaxID=2652724 RepID=A0A913XTK8_EXADI|nr:uncharacterized protein LOC110247467 [Exaiptasia diaphana]KXJ09185.1 hypothetical protein AC249_AIPGENE18753 [Exaiptasia diaphana]
MATSFYADTYTDIDGRDAIASVDVYTKSDQEGGSVNQQVTGIIKGIIINNENLNHSCCPKCTCCSDFRDVLLLPVCSIKLYDKTKIDKIVAEVYGFTNPLDVSEPDKIIQKYNHQLIPCNRKDDKNKKSVNKKKDDKSKKSVKSVSAQILTRDELFTRVRDSPKKLFAVGKCEGEGRLTFVQLRVVDENNTGQIKFEKSQSHEILSTYGPLVLGIRKIKKNGTDEYDVDAIGSYSQEDSGIIITLFGDGNDKAVQFPEVTLEQDNSDGTGSVSPQEDLEGRNPYDLPKNTHSTASFEKPGHKASLLQMKKERDDAKETSPDEGDDKSPPVESNKNVPPIPDSSKPLDVKLDKLKELRKMWKDFHSQLPEHKEKTVMRRLLEGLDGLLKELGEEKNRNFEKLQKNENENVRNFIFWIEVLQDILANIRMAVELVSVGKIEQLQKQLEDKEKIESLRENNISLEKQLENAKREINDAKVLINLQKNTLSDLLKKLLGCPDETTQQELQKEMDYFLRLVDQRLDNIIDRSHVSFDDISSSLE